MKRIYGYSYKEFMRLSEKNRTAIFDMAFKKNEQFVIQYFRDHPEVGWIMIAHRSKNIILVGSVENEPIDKEIRKKARIINRPIFIYSKPTIIDIGDWQSD